MFSGLPLPDFSYVATFVENGKAIHGQVFWCPQTALNFGQGKKKSANARSIVTIAPDSDRYLVAPVTGLGNKATLNNGFELTDSRAQWPKGKPERLWAYWPYESVYKRQLLSPQGSLTPKGKAEFRDWVKTRCSKNRNQHETSEA